MSGRWRAAFFPVLHGSSTSATHGKNPRRKGAPGLGFARARDGRGRGDREHRDVAAVAAVAELEHRVRVVGPDEVEGLADAGTVVDRDVRVVDHPQRADDLPLEADEGLHRQRGTGHTPAEAGGQAERQELGDETPGHGRLAATDVGDGAYATRLAREAKRFTSVRSELRAGTDVILKIGTWIIAPAAVLLLISQLRTASSLSEGLRATVAGVAAIVPEGLVLLTSVAFAVGVVRLGRRRALAARCLRVQKSGRGRWPRRRRRRRRYAG